MNSYLQIVCIAGGLTAAATLAAGKTGRAPEEALHIRVYDQAQVPAETLKYAMTEAGRIFRAAGIKIVWEQSPDESPEDVGLDWSSPAAPRTRPERHYVAVRIMKSMPANVVPGALGFALPFAQAGAHVAIFYDRIQATARSLNANQYVILGCAMAHEIGHVLLRSSEHSNGGLMQARWNQNSWTLASQGMLAFSADEKRQIRVSVSRLSDRAEKRGGMAESAALRSADARMNAGTAR